jgi:E3 SUMO-protein ligase PIAS1
MAACPTSRTTQPIQVRLTTEMLAKLQPKGPQNQHRIVLYCTQTDRVHFGNCVIEFPAHAEIRCNGSVVNANLRGIKNKPGTINPPDITSQSILMQGVTNKIDVTFAETRSAYTLTVYLVEKMTVDQLVTKIRKKGFISKESTLNKSSPLMVR